MTVPAPFPNQLTKDYISNSTSVLILDRLCYRATQSEHNAHVIVNGNGLGFAMERLCSWPEAGNSQPICNLLKVMGHYESLEAVLDEFYTEVAALFDHPDRWVQTAAADVLAGVDMIEILADHLTLHGRMTFVQELILTRLTRYIQRSEVPSESLIWFTSAEITSPFPSRPQGFNLGPDPQSWR
ncbi:hypothetical protein C8R46DRAFT_1220472 [Mycena filopes]|nr:hypothetical protein C8R46DRAFT_1220472 [Mycena filopes]